MNGRSALQAVCSGQDPAGSCYDVACIESAGVAIGHALGMKIVADLLMDAASWTTVVGSACVHTFEGRACRSVARKFLTCIVMHFLSTVSAPSCAGTPHGVQPSRKHDCFTACTAKPMERCTYMSRSLANNGLESCQVLICHFGTTVLCHSANIQPATTTTDACANQAICTPAASAPLCFNLRGLLASSF